MDHTPSPFREIVIESPNGQSLFALINGDVGWLMYLRTSGDAGFHSSNPHYRGDPNEMVEYELSNGQRDEYPRAWAYPTETVERALDYFRRENAPPPFITWHNDSDDGTVIVGAQ